MAQRLCSYIIYNMSFYQSQRYMRNVELRMVNEDRLTTKVSRSTTAAAAGMQLSLRKCILTTARYRIANDKVILPGHICT